MELVRLLPNVLVSAHSITSIRKEVEEGRAVYYVGLTDGREIYITDAAAVASIDSTVITGETDDPLTVELPRSFFGALLGLFRR